MTKKIANPYATMQLAPETTGFQAKWLKDPTKNILNEKDLTLERAIAFFKEEMKPGSNALTMVDWLNELKQLRGYQNQPLFARKLQRLSNTFLALASAGVKLADKGLSLAERFDEFAYKNWR